MAFYESTFIVRQDVSTQEVEKITENFSKIVSDNKGKVVKKEYWGLQNLAYKVRKNKKGHYIALYLDIANTDELTRQYKLSEDVIRSLTVKVDNISKDPSPMMKSGSGPAKRANSGDRR